MKFILFLFSIGSIFAFFASTKMLPNWVHKLNSQGYDKAAHAIIFFVLFVLIRIVFSDVNPILLAIQLAHIGLTIEFMQHYLTVQRSFDWKDAIANSVGILFGLTVTYFYNIFKIHVI